MKKIYLTLLMICMIFTSSVVYAAPVSKNPGRPEISILFNKPTIDREGEILEATISVKNVKNLAGFHINLQYDPRVLQPVREDGKTPYDINTTLKGGTILVNQTYGVIESCFHQFDKGILHFSRSYTLLDDYRKKGAEPDGFLGVIHFKVLEKDTTTVDFVKPNISPSSPNGVILIDWNGKRIEGYQIINSLLLKEYDTKPSNPSPSKPADPSHNRPEKVLSINSIKANRTSPLKPNTTVTWTCNATGEDLTYTYRLLKDGVEFSKEENTKSNTFKRTVSGIGKYVLEVTVTDAYNKKQTKYSDPIVVQKPANLKINSITVNKASSPQGGTTVTWTCNATGTNIQYAFDLYKDGVLIQSSGYTPSNKFKATLKEKGDYQVYILVKDIDNYEISQRSSVTTIK